MKKSLIFSVSLIVVLFNGCFYANEPKLDFIQTNYNEASKLQKMAENNKFHDRLTKKSTIIMATIVDIDNIEKSSTLGRAISEQVTSAFVQLGINVIELKFRENIYVKQKEGELALTREIENIAQNHSANAVVIGTYAISSETVFVNLRIIDPKTKVIISAVDYSLPKYGEVEFMLKDRTN